MNTPEMSGWQPDESDDEHTRFGRGMVCGALLTACLWGALWLVWGAIG